MVQTKQSRGICHLCDQNIAAGRLKQHLASCTAWQSVATKTGNSDRKTESLFHLQVQAEGQLEYWLDLEIRGSAKLKDLDNYLRAIWLECCGHASSFSLRGWGSQEIGMSQTIEAVFKSGSALIHIYDFGTESVSKIKRVGSRKGKPVHKRPVVLLARNLAPTYDCEECQKPASWLCFECIAEDETSGLLCNQHMKTHPSDHEAVPIVNSPRIGVCGYTGPADPPY